MQFNRPVLGTTASASINSLGDICVPTNLSGDRFRGMTSTTSGTMTTASAQMFPQPPKSLSASTFNNSNLQPLQHFESSSFNYPQPPPTPFAPPSSPSTSSDHKPLKAHRIEIHECGNATFHFRASFSSSSSQTQRFRLFLPYSSMTHCISSLHAIDTRSTSISHPMLTFPSPSPLDRHVPVWHALLHTHVGRHVHIDTLHGPRDGVLEAVDISCDGQLATVVLRDSAGRLCVHAFDPSFPSPLTISAPAHVAPRAVPDATVPLDVTAFGSGNNGEIRLSYSSVVRNDPPFDVIYKIKLNVNLYEDAEMDNVELRCFAQIPNPAHFDLCDVDLWLTFAHYREDRERRAHRYDDDNDNHITRIRQRIAGYHLKSDEENLNDNDDDESQSSCIAPTIFHNDQTEIENDEDHEVKNSNSNSDDDGEFFNLSKIRNEKPTKSSENAQDLRDLTVYKSSGPVSIQRGHSVQLPLFTAPATVRLIHCYSHEWRRKSGCARRMFAVRTSRPLEHGQAAIYFADGFSRNAWIYPSRAQRESQFLFNVETAVFVNSVEKIVRYSDPEIVSIVDGYVTISQCFDRTISYLIQNGEMKDVEIELYFWTKAATRHKNSCIIARRYSDEKDIGIEGKGEELKCMNLQLVTDRAVRIKLIEGEFSVVHIIERFARERKITLRDLNVRQIARLQMSDNVPKVAEDLLWTLRKNYRLAVQLKRRCENHRAFSSNLRRLGKRQAEQQELEMDYFENKADDDDDIENDNNNKRVGDNYSGDGPYEDSGSYDGEDQDYSDSNEGEGKQKKKSGKVVDQKDKIDVSQKGKKRKQKEKKLVSAVENYLKFSNHLEEAIDRLEFKEESAARMLVDIDKSERDIVRQLESIQL